MMIWTGEGVGGMEMGRERYEGREGGAGLVCGFLGGLEIS